METTFLFAPVGDMCLLALSPLSLLPGHLAEQDGSQCMARDMESTEKSVRGVTAVTRCTVVQ